MDTLLRDLHYAMRTLRNSPGFTAVAVMTLALGIGVNATIFSMVNAVLLKPLPVHRADELVDIYSRPSNQPNEFGTTSWIDYMEYRQQSQTLAGLVAYTNFFGNFASEGRSELVVGEIVSDNYFDVLGVPPLLGRAFRADEFVTQQTHPVVVLSHGFWQSRFSADPDVIGESLKLNGVDYTVIGVAPATFRGMLPAVRAQMWVPAMMVEEVEPLGNQRYTGGTGATRIERRGQRWLWMRGRRAEGVEPSQVQAELGAIAARLAIDYPDSNELETVSIRETSSVHINPGFDGVLSGAGALILGVVSLVLLVACANLANMLLARAAARTREIAIRLALGAGRGRLLRQMLTESLALALAGGAAGLLLASWLIQLLAAYQPPLPIDIDADFSLDWRVFAFTLLASAITGIAFGLVPALRASRPDLVPALKDSGAAEGERHGFSLRDVLVVVQVAVSIVLLVSGALLVRSLGAAQQIDLGYDIGRLNFMAIAMEMNGYDNESSEAFFELTRARLEAVPGVESVALMSRVPLSVNDNNWGIVLDGHQNSSTDAPYVTGGAYIDENYFDTLGVAVTSGRGIEADDAIDQRRVVVVSQSFADRYFQGAGVVGEQLRTGWDGDPYDIVGVVEDYRVNSPGEAPTPYLHFPLRRDTVFGNFMVRTAAPADTQTLQLEREIFAVDPEIVFLDSGPMTKLAETRLFAVKLGAGLIGAFGLLALVLAAVGLYGVIGYSVSRRTREIGIRIALGAERGRVVQLILGQGMKLVALGGLVGAVLAALTGQLLSSVLFVSALDPLAFVMALGVLMVVAAFANWLPARRAATVDPMISLRGE
jgi:predicted permease